MQEQSHDVILKLLREHGALTAGELLDLLKKEHITLSGSELHSLLYGLLRSLVTKDVDREGNQIWKLSRQKFTATKGLEFTLYKVLLDKKIISPEHAQLDYPITNRRSRKVYHLDIAIFLDERKLNIEVDGFDHLRADAMYSIQKQLRDGRKEIEIDWMDHERSFIDFKAIDAEKVYEWCARNAAWCRRFHEELIWPKDISRNLYLIENGWEIMRVWNFEVRNDMERVIKDIAEWTS